MRTTLPTRTASPSRYEEDLWQWAERREALPIVPNRKKTVLSRSMEGHPRFVRALSWCKKVLKSPTRH